PEASPAQKPCYGAFSRLIRTPCRPGGSCAVNRVDDVHRVGGRVLAKEGVITEPGHAHVGDKRTRELGARLVVRDTGAYRSVSVVKLPPAGASEGRLTFSRGVHTFTLPNLESPATGGKPCKNAPMPSPSREHRRRWSARSSRPATRRRISPAA